MVKHNQYSQVFRDIIIQDYNNCHNKTQICKKYNIGVSTLRRWIEPKYYQKSRQECKSKYYNDLQYRQKHIKNISKNRLNKFKTDPEYRKKQNAYLNNWIKNKRIVDPKYKKLTQTRVKNYIKKQYQTNPEYKIKHRLINRMRGLLNLKNITEKYYDFIGCTLKELRLYIESKFSDGMSWTNMSQWHIDHIIPCSVFNLTDPVEQKQCFHYTNLQPLWAKDNILKSNNII